MKSSIGVYAYAKATLHLSDGDFTQRFTECFTLLPVSQKVASEILNEKDSDKQALIYQSTIKDTAHRKAFREFLKAHRGWDFFWYQNT